MQNNIIILIITLCLISLSGAQEVEIDTANLFEEEFIIPEGKAEMDMEEIIMEDFPLEPMEDKSVSTGIPIPGFEFVEPEELDTATTVEFIDTSGVRKDTLVEPDIGDLDLFPEDTTTVIDSVIFVEVDTVAEDTLESLISQEVPQSLDVGYQGFNWGMTKDLFHQYVEIDSLIPSTRKDALSFYGSLGEDSVKYTYYFSPNGFWKVKIDFNIIESELDNYIDHFKRIEKYLTKKYSAPILTSRHDIGTNKEYWFSPYPKIARAYYRSSWSELGTKIELLLDARTPIEYKPAPVFEDLTTDLVLFYYRTDYYEIIVPDSSAILNDY